MERATRRSLDRVGFIAIVLGGHWLLITVLNVGRLAQVQRAPVEFAEPWIWIPATPEIPHEPEKKTRPPISRAVRAARPADAAPLPMQPGEEPEPPAVIAPDWLSEAHSVAQDMAPGLMNDLQAKCATAQRLARALPPGCKKQSYVKDWTPEPQRAGFVGIFPYVRISRCIIGLGFWSCVVQEPTPDGSLLEDFRNPNRPSSSVPDLPDQSFPQAPIPQAFK